MPPERRPAPFIGILMLDTAFPRIKGDAGNPESYPFPTRILRIAGAGSQEIVQSSAPKPLLIEAFCRAAKELEAQGAVGLISTCGFLVSVQDEIAQSVRIPVLVSALSLYPLLRQSFGGAPIGVLTASQASLEGGALAAAGIEQSGVTVAGMDRCDAFSSAILSAKSEHPDVLDTAAIEAFVLKAAREVLSQEPDTACFLLECGNMPPYAKAIREATQRPVFSILDAAALLWSGSTSTD